MLEKVYNLGPREKEERTTKNQLEVCMRETRKVLDRELARVWSGQNGEERSTMTIAGLEFDGGTATICRRALPTGRIAL